MTNTEKESTFRKLTVWEKSMDLAVDLYEVTKTFPGEERYSLVSQIQRAAVSIPSNIAEGSIRGSKKDFCHFLRIASGSIAELETQVEISKNLLFGKDLNYHDLDSLAVEVNKMIHGLIAKLKI